MKTKLIALVSSLLLAKAGFLAQAASIQWVGCQDSCGVPFPDNGSFFHGGNWLNYLPPGPQDIAEFGLEWPMSNGNTTHNPHVVHFGNFIVGGFACGNTFFVPGGNATNLALNIHTGQWVFDMASGQTLGASFPPPLTGSYTAAIIIGTTNQTSNQTSPIPNRASLTVKNGKLALCSDQFRVGNGPGIFGELVVDGTNALVTSTRYACFGLDGGTGRLLITNGGVFASESLQGCGPGSNGERSTLALVVSGTGSLLHAPALISGNGQILIEKGGGAVSASNISNGFVLIGSRFPQDTQPTLMTATVTGTGSRWLDINRLCVGESTNGNGILNVFNGGLVGSREASVGIHGGRGEVTVSGPGSRWVLDILALGGSATVLMPDRGRGMLQVVGGGIVSNRFCEIGHSVNSTGEVTVSGMNSRLQTSQWVDVGYFGNGSLFIQGQSLVSADRVYVGSETGSIGVVRITGVGSSMRLGNAMNVGVDRNGRLEIESGALLESAFGRVARGGGSFGQATVSGSGTRWSITNSMYVGGHQATGPGGKGTLMVTNSGLVIAGTWLQTWAQGTVDVAGGGRIAVGQIDPAAVPASTVWIGPGGTLAGNGTMIGNVVVNGGTLEPGSSIGILTFSNSLTLAGSALIEVNRTNSPSSDRVAASSIVFGGTLRVTNAGNVLVVGDTFTLFSATNYIAGFTNIDLPPLGLGLGWNLSGLRTNGTIRVADATARPRVLAPQMTSGTNLQIQLLSLTGVRYRLESTASLASPITWSPVTTNNGTGEVLTFTVTPPGSRQFFRVAVVP